MDQKEIDSLFSQGSITEFNKKQEELAKHMSELDSKNNEKKGRVIGQLSKVSEESEEGTNMVMGYLENVLSIISKQQNFIKEIMAQYKQAPGSIYLDEVVSFLGDNNIMIEELIFSAMDAFQFQDIGRQKLMKVMYTLARLNDYLNELLGSEGKKEKYFGHNIEKRGLEKDKEKVNVDHIVESFKSNNVPDASEDPEPLPAPKFTFPTTRSAQPGASPEEAVKIAPSAAKSNADVDDIIAEFQNKQKKQEESSRVDNSDIDSIIAEFQKNK